MAWQIGVLREKLATSFPPDPAIKMLAALDELTNPIFNKLTSPCDGCNILMAEKHQLQWGMTDLTLSGTPEQSSDDTFEPVPLLCPSCFNDHGLRLMAEACGGTNGTCPNCGTQNSQLLNRDQVLWLAQIFFVRGSTFMADYGGAPAIQFNEHQGGSLNPDPVLAADVNLLQKTLNIGFFHYGPRLWMLGSIEPLDALREEELRAPVIDRILAEYPNVTLNLTDRFYRVRKAPENPNNAKEYDAPPKQFAGTGRLDTPDHPVLYASQDLEICVHESRFAAGDELYVATLQATRPLRLLDLTAILKEDCTEFESLDLAVHMLFLAQSHSYEISRAISFAAAANGFDGLIYPSYFSLMRTGGLPFETTYGISLRRMAAAAAYERSKIISNLALFGYPVARGDVAVTGINRLVINRVAYGISFGPVTY
jgi:hypothetical protein